MVGDNLYGLERPPDYARKFERPYARCSTRRRVLRGARQPRRPESALLRARSTWEASATTRFAPRVTPVLRARQQLHGREADRVAGESSNALGSALEDLLLPPPALLLGRAPRPEVELRDELEPLFVEYGVDVVIRGARALLRAHRAAERRPLLHLGRSRTAAPREHRQLRDHRPRLRPGPPLHPRGDRGRRALLPDREPRRQDGRLGLVQAAAGAEEELLRPVRETRRTQRGPSEALLHAPGEGPPGPREGAAYGHRRRVANGARPGRAMKLAPSELSLKTEGPSTHGARTALLALEVPCPTIASR